MARKPRRYATALQRRQRVETLQGLALIFTIMAATLAVFTLAAMADSGAFI